MLTSEPEILFPLLRRAFNGRRKDPGIRQVIPRVKCLYKISPHPGKTHAQFIVCILLTGQSRDTTSEADIRVQETIHVDEVRGTPPDEMSSYYCPWT